MSAGDDYILLLIMLLLLGGGLSCLWLRGDANADVAIKGLVPRSALFLYPTVLLVLGFLPATSFFFSRSQGTIKKAGPIRCRFVL